MHRARARPPPGARRSTRWSRTSRTSRVVQGDALTVDSTPLLADADGLEARGEPAVQRRDADRRSRVLEEAPTVDVAARDGAARGRRAARGRAGRRRTYGAVSVKVAYYAEARGRRRRCRRTVFMPAPEGRLRARRASTATPTPPVDVPSPDALFALVRAGLRAAAQDAAPVAADRSSATATIEVLDARGRRSAAAGRGARARRVGARSRAGRRHDRASVAVAPRPKLTLSLRVLGTRARRLPRARGAHRLGRRARTTCSTVEPRPARACGSTVERPGGRRRARPTTTTSSSRAGDCAVLPRRRTASSSCCARRSRRARASAAARPTPPPSLRALRRAARARRRRDRRRAAAADVGSDVPFCLHGGAGVDAGPGRGARPGRRCPSRLPSWSWCRRSRSRRRRSTGPGTSSAGRRSDRAIPAPAAVAAPARRAGQRPRARGRARSSRGCVPFRDGPRGRRRARRRCSRGAGRPAGCRRPTIATLACVRAATSRADAPRCRSRARDRRVARRRLGEPGERPECGSSASGPAGDAASASSSEASCASSCACACGAS